MIGAERLRNLKAIACVAFAVACSIPLLATQTPQTSDDSALLFRDAFTLKLHLDKKNEYQKQFDKIPDVDGSDIYLFSGDSFGVNVTVSGDEITALAYEHNPDKADIRFKLSENLQGGRARMSLVGWNKLKRAVWIDALMTVPNHDGVQVTSIMPMKAGAGNYEVWPQPIVQLVLHNIRFSAQPPASRGAMPRFLSPVTTH